MSQRRLQLALDLLDLDKARQVADRASPHVDVIEVGTLLCLSEGMHAVRALRRDHPDKIIVADVRIVRAGKNIAQMAFDAGADWVSTVAEAPMATIEAALGVAQSHEGELQVELNENWTVDQAKTWFSMGIRHVIAHCTAEVESLGSGWSKQTIDTLQTLAELGFTVTAAGGIDFETLPSLALAPAHVFVVGRSITSAPDPCVAAERMKVLLA
jgi:3-dehydro-L-gulonate-6-phosphate decarboxylase